MKPTRNRTITTFVLIACGALLALAVSAGQAWGQSTGPETYSPLVLGSDGKPKPYTLSGLLTAEFCVFKDPDKQQKAYYDFMWQSFIALNWPAKRSAEAIRGQPDLNAHINQMSGTGELPVAVWETYRGPDEIFLAPNEWDNYPDWNDPRQTPNSNRAKGRPAKPYLQPFLEYATALNQPDFFPNPTGPLVDQKRGYVRYEVAVNQAFFAYVKKFSYYDGQQQVHAVAKALEDPNAEGAFQKPPFGNEDYVKKLKPFAQQGLVDVKAAWRVLTEEDHPERYLHRQIHTEDGIKRLGLVALHILRWTPNGQPESQGSFVASTFEQVDNVRVGTPKGNEMPPSGLAPSFNSGAPPTDRQRRLGFEGPIPAAITKKHPEKAIAEREPVSIYRVTPIPDKPKGKSVADANAAYQQLLKDSVLGFYELIGTQNKHPGPVSFETAADREKNGHQGPVTGVYSNTSNLINTALESYTQANHSCIQCHIEAGPQGVPTEAKELDEFRTLTFLLHNAQSKPIDLEKPSK